ncbi:MAG: WVD2 family protein, partial [Aristaeellaceae bacterium]
AVTLSDDVRKRAIELTDMWVADGSMDPSMAQLLRSDRLDELLIVDCTANDPEALNLDSIKSVVMQALTPEIEAEKEKIRIEERAEYEKKIEAVAQDNAQQKERAELAQQQGQKEAERKRLIEQSRRINTKAQNIARIIRNLVQKIGFAAFIIFIAVLSTYQVIDMYKAYSTAETSVTSIPWLEWIGRILLIIVAIYGTVTTFLDGKFTVHRLLNALERKVYDVAHEYYEQQAKEWDI